MAGGQASQARSPEGASGRGVFLRIGFDAFSSFLARGQPRCLSPSLFFRDHKRRPVVAGLGAIAENRGNVGKWLRFHKGVRLGFAKSKPFGCFI